MWQEIVGLVTNKAQAVRDSYSVNPWLFLSLLVGCGPTFYYSIYRLARALAKKETGSLYRWGTIFLASAALPYLYVLFFGRNLPWWIYAVFIVLIGQGVWSLLARLRRGRRPLLDAGTGGEPERRDRRSGTA